ncbi:MAG TPA: hypothetical protein VMA97_13235 [Streptosporangiaceae bacterium]|nr:hypothetical protein [Streptosporangiaceae bacterium]
MLTLHAVLGLALIGTALVTLVRAVRLEKRTMAVLAAAGLTAIGVLTWVSSALRRRS